MKSKPKDKLIVAADFKQLKNKSLKDLSQEAYDLANNLRGNIWGIKLNYNLRAVGYELIERIHNIGVRVFTDLKLYDTENTLRNDGECLNKFKPEILTVSAVSGVDGMKALKKELSDTKVFAVGELTSMQRDAPILVNADEHSRTNVSYAQDAIFAGLDGMIAPAREVPFLKSKFPSLSFISPAVRPTWSHIKDDDQNPDNVVTPKVAIQNGVDWIVVGRPITEDEDPFRTAMRIVAEIESAFD